ncbi:hypothetical protein [Phytohabitans kaempferiae]|uniref:hypothetical protein n=1 Tax=Phytohabitans kaempferiae TaxID=1620943 RepID=UPI0036705484
MNDRFATKTRERGAALHKSVGRDAPDSGTSSQTVFFAATQPAYHRFQIISPL